MEGGGGEMAGGEDDGGEGEGAGADKGDSGGGGTVAPEDGELKEGEFEVIGEVGEDMEVVERVIKGGQEIREMRLQKGLSVGAEADEI